MSQPGTFYVTTPIYYINGAPHLGHAYTTVACDTIARYVRMKGLDVRFLTGTDEHGQKVERAAEAQGVSPQAFADRMVLSYHEAWKALGISHDDFIRTTEERHVRGVQALWRRLVAAGDVYKDTYRGPYCTGCEAFYPESQLVDGRCPVEGHPIEILEEESYFFRLSKYQQPLLDYYHSHPDFVTPRTRMNEVSSFVEMGLTDLSISRTRITWGIPVPDNPRHVVYVWLDALANYATALGFGSDDTASFNRWWPADVHVIGKEIVRFHAVYWPAFLLSAGIDLPKQVLAHGWWLRDGQKMSKTRGNLADPIQWTKWFGADAVRYFLLREISLGADGNYSEEAMVNRINADLANDFGNTLSRITRILVSDLDARVPPARRGGPLSAAAESAWSSHVAAMDAFDVQGGIKAAWTLLDATNKYLVAEEPWKLAKNPADRNRLEEVMHESAEAMRHVATMMAPVMPGAVRDTYKRLGLSHDPFERLLIDDAGKVVWGFPDGGKVLHESALFPRIDKTSFFADVRRDAEGRTEVERETESAARTEARVGEAAAAAGDTRLPGVITYEDFAKIALRAARVKACRRHPDADKLLVVELDDGSGEPRTVCAGIAAWYAPEDLVGKTVVVVANLAPRKLRGITSYGMLLAASHGTGTTERVALVELAPTVPPGSEVR